MEKAKNPSIQGDFQQDLRATIGQLKTYPFSAKQDHLRMNVAPDQNSHLRSTDLFRLLDD